MIITLFRAFPSNNHLVVQITFLISVYAKTLSCYSFCKTMTNSQTTNADKRQPIVSLKQRHIVWIWVVNTPAGSDRLWRRWRLSQRTRRCETPLIWGWARKQCGPSSWWCGLVAGTCAWSSGWSTKGKESKIEDTVKEKQGFYSVYNNLNLLV